MKRNLFFGILASALMVFGASSAKAQIVQVNISGTAPLTEINQASASRVVELDSQFDQDAANKEFIKLLTKNKKSKEQLVAVGKFFYEQGKPYCKQFADQAYKLDPTYIPALKLCAAVCMMRGDNGGAGQKFEEILLYEPDNTEVMLYSARVYKYVNPYVSQDMLNKVLEVQPDNMEAYRQLGDIAYSLDENKEAVEKYNTYYGGTEPAKLSILSMENYLNALVAVNDFETIAKVVKVVEPLKDDDIIFKRMHFYSDVENLNTEDATESIKFITENPLNYPDSAYIYRDYAYAASFARDNGDLQQAVDFYKKGLDRDETQYVAYKEISALYRQLRQPQEAIDAYTTYLEKKGDKVDLADERGMVLCYITAKNSASTMEEKVAFAEKGDVICQKIIEMKPDSYQGPFYRAQLWTLDAQNAEEKPKEYYEQALQLLGDNADYDGQIIQSATYVAFYYLKTNDDAKCLEYCDLILKYDENNATAKQFKMILEQ